MSPSRKHHARVLLAGGDDRSLLSAARSFHRHGIPYVAVGLGPSSFVGASRHVRTQIIGGGPSAGADPAGYAAFLADVVRRHDVQVVLPLTDRTLLACDWHRDAVEAEAVLATASSAAVRNVNDKRVHLELARALGIPCPPQSELASIEQLPELVAALGFPLVLKDPGPSIDARPSLFPFTWLIAWNEAQLRSYLSEYCRPGEYPLFQALVRGTARNVCCFAVGGEIVAICEYRDLRRLSGLSVYREMTSVTPELRRYAEAMLRELRWDGAAHLEFFVDDGSGEAWYMETNGRFWASIEGPVAAGWDFPLWTYEYFAEGTVPDPPPAAHGTGRRSCWRYGDLVATLRRLSGGYEQSTEGRARMRTVTDYVKGFDPRIAADVFRLDDPLPELVEHWQGVRLVLSRLRQRAARALAPSRRGGAKGSRRNRGTFRSSG